MNDRIVIALALSPIWMALLYALLVAVISGPGYTTAVNQGSMAMRFLGLLAYPFIMLLPVYITRKHAAPGDLSRITALCFVSWLVGPIIVYGILVGMK